MPLFLVLFFFLNVTSTTEIYTLSLHDALPILILLLMPTLNFLPVWFALSLLRFRLPKANRSEERFSRNAETDRVCRFLLEKKKGNSALIYNLPSLVPSQTMPATHYHRDLDAASAHVR